MKKSFFGYNVSEADIMINTLREENESLNATITTLNTQIKNGEAGTAKSNLLEADLESSQSNIKKLTEENIAITSETETLKLENTDLMAQIESLHTQIEDIQAQLSFERTARENLELELSDQVEKLTAATAELDNGQENSLELQKAHQEIKQLQEELNEAMITVEELNRIKIMDKQHNLNQKLASEISFKAYYNMSKMYNEVVDNVQEQMKEYYKHVNDNTSKMRNDIEQCQTEYSQMMREFFSKASEFRVTLSNIESKYGTMTDYKINTDKISNSMNEIINDFLEETDSPLKEKDTEPNNNKDNDTNTLLIPRRQE